MEEVACFNNEQGVAKYPRGKAKCFECGAPKHYQSVKYGVGEGGSDLLCIVRNAQLEYGQFVGIEIKTGNASLMPNQRLFRALVRRFGGIAEVARSASEAREIVKLAAGIRYRCARCGSQEIERIKDD